MKRWFIEKWSQTSELVIGRFWARHDKTILHLAIFAMSLAALIWLGYEFWRLLFQTEFMGAIDLLQRHRETLAWFDGRAVYQTIGTACYPPASYVIFWPHLGWLGITAVRWSWAISTVAMLAWLVRISVRESGMKTPLMFAFAGLVPLSIYPSGATIGNGQLPIHILPLLITSLILFRQKNSHWRKDLLGAFLFLIALVKPSVTAPFFWIVLFSSVRLRPAMFVVLGYVGLTCLASLFHEAGPIQLLYDWQTLAKAGADWGAQTGGGSNNVHGWLDFPDMPAGNTAFSLIPLMALGVWSYFHRRVDLWLLMGVAAVVARLWTYHRWYDDLLILLPMIALLRIANRNGAASSQRLAAAILFAITLLFMMAPGGLYLLPPPWKEIYVNLQAIIWIGDSIFLLVLARKNEKAAVSWAFRKR